MRPLKLITDNPASATGRDYWRSLDEFAATPAFRELMEREFPAQASEWSDPISRRRFLTLMGASFALAGLSGCRTRPASNTYATAVHKHNQLFQGKPLYFATAMPHAGGALGLLVESHEGRPTKVEGNPKHPASLGATDPVAQAAVLTLYDPDRSRALTYLGRIRGWNDTLADLQTELPGLKKSGGRGLRVLSETVVSPTLVAQRDELLTSFPEARWCEFEPAVSGNGRAGRTLAFGEPCDVYYRLADAKRVVTFDADLFSMPGGLAYARQLSERRRQRSTEAMNRLYAVESTPTTYGLWAEHRLPLRPTQVESFARVLAAKLGVGVGFDGAVPKDVQQFADALASDLTAHVGASAVIAGESQPPTVHALALAINDMLGNIGKSVVVTAPIVSAPPKPLMPLPELVAEMRDGKVEVLLVLGGNPAYTAPADMQIRAAMAKVPLKLRLGLFEDETSRECQWHIPETHFLESWGDCVAHDGTASVIQPLIEPLYSGRSAHEVLAVFSDKPNRSTLDIVQDAWRDQHRRRNVKEPFESFWQRSLHDGVVAGSAVEPKPLRVKADWKEIVAKRQPEPFTGPADGLDVSFRCDPTVHDGAFANNGWLQELPKPITKLTWDNAVIVSPNTAASIGVSNRLGVNGGSHGETVADCVNLSLNGVALSEVPCFILPSHPDGCATLHLGYGRTVVGKVGTGTGFDANQLRRAAGATFDRGLRITKGTKQAVLACTQSHHLLPSREGHTRGFVRGGTLNDYLVNGPKHLAEGHHGEHDGPLPSVAGMPQKPPAVGRLPLDLYPAFPYDGYKWGMSVDLSACIGCTACVVACQSENNIPVVGKDQVTRGREMHWMRIDHYYQGDPAHPESIALQFEPVMCQHCENAPCEVVCPVEATTHSPDGLNEMTYNRCVGTRYCSNNCPYKVRRFNFFLYADYATESLKLQRNPEVTVRSRGVMEKCTFCVQRIRNAEIDAKNQRRSIRDGEIVTACQAVCPTNAIVFGDMNDTQSKVYKAKTDELTFGILTELNTRPRTTYAAAVRNPNPQLARTDTHGGH